MFLIVGYNQELYLQNASEAPVSCVCPHPVWTMSPTLHWSDQSSLLLPALSAVFTRAASPATSNQLLQSCPHLPRTASSRVGGEGASPEALLSPAVRPQTKRNPSSTVVRLHSCPQGMPQLMPEPALLSHLALLSVLVWYFSPIV